ncbi:MlaD family protein [Mycobacterium kyogaense]|uniref:MlaD family protein n=1 Tax=Mycobacterium kyogaense TaxID=2212479 RepID=UPI000DAF2AA0|nr:MlaD family protein [Mycobacterium kyogaense]
MTDLIRTSAERQKRILVTIGTSAVALIATVATVLAASKPFGDDHRAVVSVAIDTPYVGQGVVPGTPVIMHGVRVGQVDDVDSLSAGGVRLRVDLQSKPVIGLTDNVGIDFRPANYFGVTGVNLIPADGGQPLRDGTQIRVTPKGNFALQALLYRLGELSDQVVTPQLIDVVERATRYTDAMTPFLETMIIVSTSVTNVQTVSTEKLLRNTTGINAAFPGFLDALIGTGDLYLHADIGVGFDSEKDLRNNEFLPYYTEQQVKYYNEAREKLRTNPDEFVKGRLKEWLKGAETDLFSAMGRLLSTHVNDLFPVVDQMRVLVDTVPALVPAGDVEYTLRELRTRLERMYEGSGEQRALQVRLILDELPGVAVPMGLVLGAAQ